MGGGTYCSTTRLLRSEAKGYTTKSTQEIFTAQNINSAMSPFGINVRESRDSVEHPNSLAIVLALDETGSMGTVPHYLVKEGLPLMMDSIIKSGIADPQVLFLGIGDHECDQAPLQVGQFESSDELLDKWLTDLYLEGHGGGNAGESYMLAWYFAAHHTAIDCFEKRLQKGVLITIGDEPVLPHVPANFLKNLMGPGQYENYSSQKLLDEAREKYDVYHIHVRETGSGSRQSVMDGWRQLLVDNLLIAERRTDVARLVVEAVCESAEIDNVQHVTAPVQPAETMML
uniref:Putative von Willebrand domain containing protein n=2 Tax=viral metagenome TaxID=1070528 RepID=A0A6M3JQA9_9ZZZZ